MGLLNFFTKSNKEKIQEETKEKASSKDITIELSAKPYLGKKEEIKIVAPFPFEAEACSIKELSYRQREALMDKFDNYADKFLCAADDVRYEFEFGSFDYKVRLRLINKACKAFDKAFEIAAPYWYEDWDFMVGLELTDPNKWTVKDCLDNNPQNALEVDDAPEKYNFNNINFLRWILSEYEELGDELKPLLEEKEFRRLVRESGSEEEARKELEWRKEQEKFDKGYTKFKSKVKNVIVDNPGILQKDIKNHFGDEFWHKHIPKALKEFEESESIIKLKCGRTYEITWKG